MIHPFVTLYAIANDSPFDKIKRTYSELINCKNSLDDARKVNFEKRKKIILFIFCSLGVLVFYLLFGILQEDITKDGYGKGYPNGPDYWIFMITLVWVRYLV